MSKLTDALNRIMNWLEEYQPEHVASYLPGLSRSEIDKLIKPFNLLIPEEIYELYQWRNGRDSELLDTYITFGVSIDDFLPLHDAVKEDLIGWINNPQVDGGFLNTEYEGRTLFPFLGHFDPDLFTISLSSKEEESYPVVSLAEGCDPLPICPSVTSMMCMLAEAYETGAYYFNENNNKWIEVNSDKIMQIAKKHGAYINS